MAPAVLSEGAVRTCVYHPVHVWRWCYPFNGRMYHLMLSGSGFKVACDVLFHVHMAFGGCTVTWICMCARVLMAYTTTAA